MKLPDKKTWALKALAKSIAYADAGVSRTSDPAQVGRFDAFFGLSLKDPFCAAEAFFCVAVSLAELIGDAMDMETLESLKPIIAAHFLTPTASCGEILADAKVRGVWLSVDAIGDNQDILPGWWVLYNWHGGDAPEHVGMVEHDQGDVIADVEANTSSASNANGGTCAHKDRDWSCVLGFVRTY